jgi:hypothetical protein
MGSIADQLATNLASETMRNYKRESATPGPKVIMPGGGLQSIAPYLSGLYKMQDNQFIYSEPYKELSAEWIADHPGWEYIFALADDKLLGGRIRQGMYEYVPESALKEDSGLPYQTFKTAKGVDSIQVGDLVLVCCSPQVYERLFKIKEALGVRQLAGNFEKFDNDVSSTGGEPESWVETNKDDKVISAQERSKRR